MHLDERTGLVVHRFDTLPAQRLDALVSTRSGGVSEPPYASLNLGLRVGDEPEAVLENRRRLFAAYDLPLASSVWCRQVHTDGVTVVTEADAGRGAFDEESIVQETDALVTDVINLPLCVTLADCVPVVIYDAQNHVVALAHAGWGGTTSRISSRTVATMETRFGSDPENLFAGIGPSISPDDYEVGGEVIKRVRAVYGEKADQILKPLGEEKALFDLWAANRFDLEASGIPLAQIEVAQISTARKTDEFYSHRLEGPTGRFIAAAMLLPI
jgi:hypothetical protein